MGLGCALLVLALAGVGVYSWLFITVPAPVPPVLGDTRIVAADGSLIATLRAEEHSKPVGYDAISRAMIEAVVVKEDEHFFEHHGLDYGAMARALLADLKAGRVVQGGSTITQQYVKTTLGDRSRTIRRKIREILTARKVEDALSKEEILTRYLNTIYFGRGAYGIEAAAQRYFGLHASDLDYPQAALLAALISAPSLKSPRADPAGIKAQRDALLRRMADRGYLAPETARQAVAAPLGLVDEKPEKDVRWPFVAAQAEKELGEALAPEKAFAGGLTIETSFDPRLQQLAEASVAALRPDVPGLEIALVSVEPATGRIRAMVAGADYGKSQFNLVTQARRQPGSAFKPFVLAAALEKNLDPKKTTFPGSTPYVVRYTDAGTGEARTWVVQNYEGESYGTLDLVEATVRSVNTVYAQLVQRVGPQAVVDVARRAGIVSPLAPNPAIALGGLELGVSPLEMASAYATFANDGFYNPPHLVTRVRDREGEVLYIAPHAEQPALRPEIALGVTRILQEVVARGTGSRARLGSQPAAGKTGTSQDFRDAWFVGYTPQLSTAVWMGYAEAARSMEDTVGKAAGGTIPAQVWHDYMQAALADAPVVPFASEGMVVVSICPQTMKRAVPACPDAQVLALPANQVPKAYCDMHGGAAPRSAGPGEGPQAGLPQ